MCPKRTAALSLERSDRLSSTWEVAEVCVWEPFEAWLGMK